MSVLYIYSHTCIWTRIHSLMLVCLHTYMNTYVHTYLHARKHTDFHTYMHTCQPTNIHEFSIPGFPDFHIPGICVILEIWKSILMSRNNFVSDEQKTNSLSSCVNREIGKDKGCLGTYSNNPSLPRLPTAGVVMNKLCFTKEMDLGIVVVVCIDIMHKQSAAH